jgi:transcriptional regulator with XRE-family HTH domain
MTAAQLVAEARERSGLSQRELAARAETSAAAVCEVEGGRRDPRTETLERIIEAAGGRLALAVHWDDRREIDLAGNGRVLADLLDLVDLLPHRRDGALDAPVLAREAR